MPIEWVMAAALPAASITLTCVVSARRGKAPYGTSVPRRGRSSIAPKLGGVVLRDQRASSDVDEVRIPEQRQTVAEREVHGPREAIEIAGVFQPSAWRSQPSMMLRISR